VSYIWCWRCARYDVRTYIVYQYKPTLYTDKWWPEVDCGGIVGCPHWWICQGWCGFEHTLFPLSICWCVPPQKDMGVFRWLQQSTERISLLQYVVEMFSNCPYFAGINLSSGQQFHAVLLSSTWWRTLPISSNGHPRKMATSSYIRRHHEKQTKSWTCHHLFLKRVHFPFSISTPCTLIFWTLVSRTVPRTASKNSKKSPGIGNAA